MKNKIRLYTILSGSLMCTLLFGLRTAALVFAAAPSVTTSNIDQLTSTGVRFQGSANPNSISTTGYFRMWTTNPGSCSDVGGTRIPSAGGAALGAGSTNVNYSYTTASQGINLTPNTTYYYCAIATNGTLGYGSLKYFITQQGQTNSCDAPLNGSITISSGSCNFPGSSNVTGMDGAVINISSGATLTLLAGQQVAFQTINKPGGYINKFSGATIRKGYVWVKDVDGDGYFDQSSALIDSSPSTPPGVGYVRRNTFSLEYLSQAVDCNDNDNTTYRQMNVYADLDSDGYGAGSASQQCSGQDIPSGYSSNNSDCNNTYSGATTDCSPQSVTNSTVTSITSSTATLNGSANTVGFAGTGYFKWGTTNIACASQPNTTSTVGLSALTTSQAFNIGISSLSPNTTYYWCTGSDNSQTGSPKYAISNSSFVSAPGTPTSVSSNTVTQTTLNLTWTAPSGGAGGYRVYRCNRTSNGSCAPSYIGADADNSSPHPDTGLLCNTQYAYQVSGTTGSSGSGNEGSLSSPVYTVTTGACCTNGYVDNDGDGYGSGSFGCYSSGAIVAQGGDCYDVAGGSGATNTRPGQASYFATANGLGSFDYDCSGGLTANVSPTRYCSSWNTSDDFYTTPNTCGSLAVAGGYWCTSSAAYSYPSSLPTACGKYTASGPWYALSGGCVSSTIVREPTQIRCK